jgi:dynein heavy chain
MYNQREFLVGKEQRDYSCVATMMKDFQPFANLWKTNRTWNTKSQSWLNGNWSKLDPDDLDTTFENCNKIASQAFRFFRDKNDLKNIFSIAEKMKA